MDDETRADLVEELEEALRNAYGWGLDSKRYSPLLAVQPFVEKIDRLLADRAVPEPDAAAEATATDAVERVKAAIRGVLKSAWEDDDEKLIYPCDIDAMARAALAAVPTVQAAAGDDLDAMLRHLTDDDLPGKTLSIYRHDGQWGVQQHMTHLEEQYPTDVCGHGDGVLEAIANAVDNAKKGQE